jgi:polyisoprenoid-binding protein YceI
MNSPTLWKLDPSQSSVTFTVKHMMFSKVHGSFKITNGSLTLDREAPASSRAEASIDVASVDTRDQKRDEYIKGADFFNVARFPSMKFKSTRFEKKRAGEYLITGDLSIRDTTRSVTLVVAGLEKEMNAPAGKLKIGATATTKISRKDFGLTWNAAIEAGGVLVGDEINVNLEIQFEINPSH